MKRNLTIAAAAAFLTYLLFGAFVLNAAPGQSSFRTTEHFFLWDSELFRSIAENGYRFELEMADPGRSWSTNNVAYPPLYPFVSRVVKNAFDMPWEEAMVLVSNLATVVALGLLILIMQRLNIGAIWCTVVLAGFAIFPGSVWLLAAYSDALSLALAFAIIYVALGVREDSSKRRALLLLLLGLLLGMTHFRTSVLTAAGVMMGVTWWLRGELDGKPWTDILRIWLLLCLPALGAALAFLGFFFFCYLAFGRWDAYQQTIYGVWGVSTADFLQVFDLNIYRWFSVSLAQDHFNQGTPYLGRFLATWFLTISMALLVFEVFFGTTHTGRGRRVNCSPGLWALLLSLLMQYFLITMRVPSFNNFLNYPMPSVRYLIPCALLIAIYIAQLIPEILKRRNAAPEVGTCIGLIMCTLLLLGGLAVQQRVLELYYMRILQG